MKTTENPQTKNIEPYWNKTHTKYAILYTKGMYTGWSIMNVPELAYDSRVVGYVIEHLKTLGWQQSFDFFGRGKYGQPMSKFFDDNPNAKEFKEFLSSIGYEYVNLMPIAHINVIWVKAGRKWRIIDGGECQEILEFEDEIEWNSFE